MPCQPLVPEHSPKVQNGTVELAALLCSDTISEYYFSTEKWKSRHPFWLLKPSFCILGPTMALVTTEFSKVVLELRSQVLKKTGGLKASLQFEEEMREGLSQDVQKYKDQIFSLFLNQQHMLLLCSNAQLCFLFPLIYSDGWGFFLLNRLILYIAVYVLFL